MNNTTDTPFEAVPEIRTPRLLLRAFTLADAPAVTELAGAKEIADTTLFIPHPYSIKDAETWIKSHAEELEAKTAQHFAVTAHDGTLMGAISLMTQMEYHRAEMGYWIGKAYWGNNYCTEAAAALLEYGFSHLKLNRIFAYCFKRNTASAKVLEKIGMQLEGVLKQHIKKYDQYEDLFIYGRLTHLATE